MRRRTGRRRERRRWNLFILQLHHGIEGAAKLKSSDLNKDKAEKDYIL